MDVWNISSCQHNDHDSSDNSRYINQCWSWRLDLCPCHLWWWRCGWHPMPGAMIIFIPQDMELYIATLSTGLFLPDSCSAYFEIKCDAAINHTWCMSKDRTASVIVATAIFCPQTLPNWVVVQHNTSALRHGTTGVQEDQGVQGWHCISPVPSHGMHRAMTCLWGRACHCASILATDIPLLMTPCHQLGFEARLSLPPSNSTDYIIYLHQT